MSVNLVGQGVATFLGGTGIGAVSVPGLKVGDRVILEFVPGVQNSIAAGVFEPVITVDDEIQQTASSNFSAITCTIYFWRGP